MMAEQGSPAAATNASGQGSAHGCGKKRMLRPEAGESPACKAARKMFVEGNLTQDKLIHVIQADDRYIRKQTGSTCVHLERDHITLEPLGENQFLFVRPNGAIVRYNADSLADYFLVSGHFFEPESRIAVTEQDLVRLDQELGEAGVNKPSVTAAWRYNRKEYEEKALEKELVDGLDRCAGEVVEKMRQVIETATDDTGCVELCCDVFPYFTGWYIQLLQVDEQYAMQCLDQYVSAVTGPPNNPTKEMCTGMKACVLTFLASQRQLRAEKHPETEVAAHC